MNRRQERGTHYRSVQKRTANHYLLLSNSNLWRRHFPLAKAAALPWENESAKKRATGKNTLLKEGTLELGCPHLQQREWWKVCMGLIFQHWSDIKPSNSNLWRRHLPLAKAAALPRENELAKKRVTGGKHFAERRHVVTGHETFLSFQFYDP